jgi:hypothetical protein
MSETASHNHTTLGHPFADSEADLRAAEGVEVRLLGG